MNLNDLAANAPALRRRGRPRNPKQPTEESMASGNGISSAGESVEADNPEVAQPGGVPGAESTPTNAIPSPKGEEGAECAPNDPQLATSSAGPNSTPAAESSPTPNTIGEQKRERTPRSEALTAKQSQQAQDPQELPYWLQFATALLSGCNATEAYRLARPTVSARWGAQAIRGAASELSRDSRVIEHIAAEKERIIRLRRRREERLLDGLERREICAGIARNEEEGGAVRLLAIKTDSQLAGEWLERVESTSTVQLGALIAQLPATGLPIARNANALRDSAELSPSSSIDTQSAHATLPGPVQAPGQPSPQPSAIEWEWVDE